MNDEASEGRPGLAQDFGSLQGVLISFSSGNGGTGVSYLATQFSLWLSRLGKKTLLVDANWSLGSSHFFFGIEPDDHFAQYLEGKRTLRSCVKETKTGVSVLAGCPGLGSLSGLSHEEHLSVRGDLEPISREFDCIILDIPSGLGGPGAELREISTFAVIVATPDPLSLTSNYALLKNIVLGKTTSRVGVVVNRCTTPNEGRSASQILAGVSDRFLNFTPVGLGFLPFDLQLLRRPSGTGSISKVLEDLFSRILSVIETLPQELPQ
ncbi:MAG: AAA family ATPase [Candidatus Eisenbacteria bacterium]|nr:AAA family ATPase [Candidatus Eisenbacteria bacterium]